ncbi:hypothetical protein KDN34_02820 [Shewanella yunxiaonensis]|uniref:Curli production assembly/transport component CsgG n=1 Tax=Shewanella yunxiaonensis TaxID=2829809 RepID=A0ABX7YUH6_9GAMM|nr:CsgG/HfaB family protein [Shewanella yunxiaonensis]QUN06414.1 hypothetical protein KDN34_02820 [Shewanella yunxiaonensis]
MKKGVFFGSTAIVVILLSGCNITQQLNNSISYIANAFSSPKVPVSYMKPANIAGAEEMHRIAVMEQRNDGTVSFVESNLTGIRVNSIPYFTLVDRSTLDKIIKEQKFSDGMLANSATRVKFGKLSGADTIVSGILSASVSSTNYSKEVSKCSDSKCKNSYETTISCTKRTGVAVFEPKAVSVETGQILFSKNYTRSVDSESCTGEGDALLSENELKGRAFALIADDFKEDVAPHIFTVNVELFESDDSDMNDTAEKYFDIAVELAEKNRIDNACSMFAKAQGEYASSVALAYNNGVCAEYSGDLEKAEAFYSNAETLTQDVDKLKYIMDGEDRLKVRNSDIKVLSQLSGAGRI